MNIIVAVDNKWGIGKNGNLLIKIPDDLKFFKNKTIGNTIIVGRKTFEDFPNKKPLSGRRNIILSHNYSAECAEVYKSVEDILNIVKKSDKDVFIAGGSEIYKEFLPYCKKAYVTKIYADLNADKFIENIDDIENWKCINESNINIYKGIEYRFCEYERI